MTKKLRGGANPSEGANLREGAKPNKYGIQNNFLRESIQGWRVSTLMN